jgi:hypothetical protein
MLVAAPLFERLECLGVARSLLSGVCWHFPSGKTGLPATEDDENGQDTKEKRERLMGKQAGPKCTQLMHGF